MNQKDENGIGQSSKSVILGILAVMALLASAIFFISSPTGRLLGESAYKMRGAFHGLFAGVFMVTVTIGLYQAFRLWSGTPVNIREFEIGSAFNSVVCFITIVFGNWIYIPYRAPGGPRSYFLETSPEIHKIFFEFKEFTALFALPFVVGATYLIFRYGERLQASKPLREMAALLLVLAFFYFAVAFGLGAAITKLKSV